MKQQLEHRLQELKTEFTSGQKVLAELEEKRSNIQSTLLRIQGAIQVLEEELAKADEAPTNGINGAADRPADNLVLAEAPHSIQTS